MTGTPRCDWRSGHSPPGSLRGVKRRSNLVFIAENTRLFRRFTPRNDKEEWLKLLLTTKTLAQNILLYLSHGVARQFIDEVNALGDFEIG